jgi:glucose-6-phosphate isomerase
MIEVRYSREKQLDSNSSLYKKLLEAHQRLLVQDFTIWGAEASAEARIRMDWISLPEASRSLLPQLDALSAKNRHLTHVILCGMGGSSLGPEVIAQTYGKKLFVLDSTDPNYLKHAIPKDLEKTLVIISSKSGSTIETESFKSFFEALFEGAGLNKAEHMIIVTDPSVPLDVSSRSAGFNVINANPNVGGRFSVLGAFGLIPSALIGVDVSIILDSAIETREFISANPHAALVAAYAIIEGTNQYFSLTDELSNMPGLSSWIEQLLAESTGKNGVGRLPIVLSHSEELTPEGTLSISFKDDADLIVKGDLGSQFFFWQWVTALVGAGLSINPFDQPDVQESKFATASVLSAWGNHVPELANLSVDRSIALFDECEDASMLLSDFIRGIADDGYLAIAAFMDRESDVELMQLREIIAKRTKKAVTFGWGPRFLHSTGQIHKGGQSNGSFLQISAECDKDFAINGQDFTFRTLCMAQAIGNHNALAARGLRSLRLHLTKRKEGISQLLEIAKNL